MIPFFQRKSASSMLGLWLDGNRLEGVVVRRTNGSAQIRQRFAASLALSPLTGDPELVGREIRNHLDKAGIRERRCALCLPARLVLAVQTQIPDLPEAEVAGFLQLEAERGFHSGLDELMTAQSLFRAGPKGRFATLMAVPRSQLAALEAALTAAKLKPFTFALETAALQRPGEAGRVITLAVGVHSLDLQITAGGGIAALRSLDNAFEAEDRRISAELVARELRITLGELPGEPGGVVRIFAQTEMGRLFAAEVSPRLLAMGLKVETAPQLPETQFDGPVPPELAASPALALAAACVRGVKSNPEFLPPKIQAWKQFAATRLSARKLAYAGGALGFAVACVLLAFGVQQFEIMRLQSKWDKMSARVAAINDAQDQIRKYRSWYDPSFRALRVFRCLANAFSEDGSVSAKNVEIRDLTAVSCSGTATDNTAFLRLQSRLGDAPGVSALHAEVPHGQKPLQFSLNFNFEGSETNNGD